MDGSEGPMGTLLPKDVDFSNITQATMFLADLLNDDQLKVVGNAYARYFWYCIAVLVGLACVFNVIRWATLKRRCVVVKFK